MKSYLDIRSDQDYERQQTKKTADVFIVYTDNFQHGQNVRIAVPLKVKGVDYSVDKSKPVNGPGNKPCGECGCYRMTLHEAYIAWISAERKMPELLQQY